MKTTTGFRPYFIVLLWFLVTILWAFSFQYLNNYFALPLFIWGIEGVLAVYITAKMYAWASRNKKSVEQEILELKKKATTLYEVEGAIQKIEAGEYEAIKGYENSKEKAKLLLYKVACNLEKETKEEEKRNWANLGLANFGDYLRSSANLSEVTTLVLSKLNHYVDAFQGQIYIIKKDENSSYLELVADYAGEGKGKINKRVEKGEGIIGQVWIDEKYTHLKDVPSSYFKIQSGGGSAAPTNLIVIPLIHNEQMQGVLELASFHVFETYQVEFLLKVSENIATTLFNIQIAEQNNVFYRPPKNKLPYY